MRLFCAVVRVPGIVENDAPGAGIADVPLSVRQTCVDVNQRVLRVCMADDRLNTLVQPSRGAHLRCAQVALNAQRAHSAPSDKVEGGGGSAARLAGVALSRCS